MFWYVGVCRVANVADIPQQQLTIFIVLTTWLTDWLTDSVGQSPSREAKRLSATQEIPRILRNR